MLQTSGRAVASAAPPAFVRRWLFVVAWLIALMMLAGAAARLAPGLELARFNTILPWDSGHRLLEWLIGLAFTLPLALFWLKGFVRDGLRGRLLGILALGALQGFSGWWLAASGLAGRMEGTQAWRAVDPLLAAVVFIAVLWTAEGLRPGFRDPMGRDARGFRFEAGLLLALAFAQIGFGALAAGLTFNNWPLTDGRFFPPADEVFSLSPFWANFFDNPVTMQVQHRVTGALIALVGLFHAFHISRERLARRAVRRALVLAGLVVAQAGLGVMASAAPLAAALAHQALAIGVLALAAIHRRKLG